MKLINVVMYIKTQRLEATVEDNTGRRRRVTFDWLSKGTGALGATSWYETVAAELADQDAEALRRSKGGGLL